MNIIKKSVAKMSLFGLLLTLAVSSFYAPTASAHGEKSQAAFMRMRTIMWYDLNWSTDELNVNETMDITGTMYVFHDWPESVNLPTTSFLNIGIPGPVFIRQESYIGDKIVPRSVELHLGNSYDFKVVLKARRPGEWHIHTMINVDGGGPVIGPGKWATINGSMSDFTNEITALTGQTFDLEDWQLSTIYAWHTIWYIVGIAWIVWWVRRPVFIPRMHMIKAGRAKELITPTDKKVTLAFLIGTLALVLVSYNSANSNFPVTIPLQAGKFRSIPVSENTTGDVHVTMTEATYRVPGRAMRMVVSVHNGADEAVRLGEFMGGSIRFLNADVAVDEAEYPENLLAPEGLSVSPDTAIAPGETAEIEVIAGDAAWEIERMSDIIYDPDSRMAGMLFFYEEGSGDRHMAIVNGPLIPIFM